MKKFRRQLYKLFHFATAKEPKFLTYLFFVEPLQPSETYTTKNRTQVYYFRLDNRPANDSLDWRNFLFEHPTLLIMSSNKSSIAEKNLQFVPELFYNNLLYQGIYRTLPTHRG